MARVQAEGRINASASKPVAATPAAAQAGALRMIRTIAKGIAPLAQAGQRAARTFDDAEAVRWALMALRDTEREARGAFSSGGRVTFGQQTTPFKASQPKGDVSDLLKRPSGDLSAGATVSEVVKKLGQLQKHVAAAGYVAQRNSVDFTQADHSMQQLDQLGDAIDRAVGAFKQGDTFTFGHK